MQASPLSPGALPSIPLPPPFGDNTTGSAAYDGKDFLRSKTTMLTADGKSAVDTKLDRDSPAHKALSQKHSYVGDAKVFGRDYDAEYAPLIGDDGRLTGALFIGVPK